MIICTWRMGASNLKLILISPTWDCTTFHNFLSISKKKSFPCSAKSGAQRCRYCHMVVSSWTIKHFDFQKLAGLLLAGQVVNHVGIFGSKKAECCSAFHRRSCFRFRVTLIGMYLISPTALTLVWPVLFSAVWSDWDIISVVFVPC